MGTLWTADRVLQLAPDPASAKAGRDLSAARKWALLAGDETALWGLCQGSGSKPYQVQIDLTEVAFKCSCPSRKFPCKHGLGLLLIYAATPELMQQQDRPAWVLEWFAGRTQRAEKKAAAVDKPVDVAAQAKRREDRLSKVTAAAADLGVWAEDLIRGGLSAAPAKGYAFFDQQARRLIDGQAPGAARLVQVLGATAAAGGDLQGPFLRQLAGVHLLARATAKLDRLPEAAKADVLATLGVPVRPEELAAKPGVRDVWQVVGQEVEQEDKLRVQRTWLFGTTTRRPAMVLQFAHGTTGFETPLVPGSQVDCELAYHTDAGVRANVKGMPKAAVAIGELVGFETFDAVVDDYAKRLAGQPWLERVAVPVRRVTVVKAEKWQAVDSARRSLPIAAGRDDAAWACLAVAGGRPADLVAEFDGHALRLISIFADGRLVSLTTEAR